MPGKDDAIRPTLDLLLQVWREHSDLFTKHMTELSEFSLDQLVSSVFSNGPFYYFVFDLADLSLRHISEQMESVQGLKRETLTFAEVLDQIHPEDIAFVARAEDTAIKMFRDKIGIDKVKQYKFSYCFRMKVADGSYRLFNHQSAVLTTDQAGRAGKMLKVYTDISHLATENNHCVSLIGMDGEPSFLNLDVVLPRPETTPSHTLFTEREVTVIRLISTGLTSAEIAKELTLSEFTVKNHRKRILKKAKCQNMNQLLGSCIVDGLI
ncbi:LuxR C-terminal-related transcriptional regulator [Microbulbifer sp. SA54]|uniref:LuxR C-terminal-related transcriptional regulator n=1 Tax=Microbulbifer sp. SA54 TaxID=3401577 RepID=UPI003AACE3BF